MGNDTLSFCVAGGGSWGTALAHLAASNGHDVTLYLRNAAVCDAINTKHENPAYLSGCPFIPQSGPASIQMFSRPPSSYWPFPARRSGPFSQPTGNGSQKGPLSSTLPRASSSPPSARVRPSFLKFLRTGTLCMPFCQVRPSPEKSCTTDLRPLSLPADTRRLPKQCSGLFPAHSSAAMPPQMFWALKSEARSRISLP